MPTSRARLSVVLFSGGRGSGGLSRQLVTHPDVALTIAINGCDAGASTGEIRRFLGDSLGPSDFRKNAARLAGEIRSCPESLPVLLDRRLAQSCSSEQGIEILRQLVFDPNALCSSVIRNAALCALW